MRFRCNSDSVSNKHFKYYRGRGIRVCDEWNDFRTFEKWCIETYEPGKSIDRIDNNGCYSPENCRWATALEQSQNARKRTEAQIAAAKNARAGRRKFLIKKYGDPLKRKQKLCGSCRIFIDVSNFYKSKNHADGLQGICKSCDTKAMRERRARK